MISKRRLKAAFNAFSKHLAASLVVAALSAFMVFKVWYPYPYFNLIGGRELFFLVTSIDVIVGPVLTLIVFSPDKSRVQLVRDLGFVVLVQVFALIYGLHSVLLARPVFLAFEGDRFRVVRAVDVVFSANDESQGKASFLSYSGPKLIGVRLSTPTDKNYLQSIELALRGVHPSYRAERWVDYSAQKAAVLRNARPIEELIKKYPKIQSELDGLEKDKVGYLPLIAGYHDDWVVIVDLYTAQPKKFLHFDGW